MSINKEYLEMADRLLGESHKEQMISEDDGKKLVMDFAVALGGYEDFRQDVMELVKSKYPEKSGKMQKEFTKVDKAMAALEKFIKGL